MDPITQGALGAAAALSLRFKIQDPKPMIAAVAVAGWIGGMAADLDVVIRSSSDPLLAVEFHRHFTHSLFFIPFGGLIVGLFLMAMGSIRRRFTRAAVPEKFWNRNILVAATIGYATHGLLDACTSYGTQLLWPFSNIRVAWNNIGIIDPIPTTLWIGSMLFAFRLRRGFRPVGAVRALFVLGLVYLLLGVVQRERASDFQEKLISERGIEIEKVSRRVVKPTMFQIFLWRSIYQHEGRYTTDGIHVGLTGHRIYKGESVDILNRASLSSSTRLDEDLRRFDWFSDGWLAAMPDTPEGLARIGDMRYALLPQEIRPLWGIEFDRTQTDRPVDFKNFRDIRDGDAACFRNMMFGWDCQ